MCTKQTFHDKECRPAHAVSDSLWSRWSVLWGAAEWRWSVASAWGAHYLSRSDCWAPPRAGRSRCRRHPRVPPPPTEGSLPLCSGPALGLWWRHRRPAGPSLEPGRRAVLSPEQREKSDHYFSAAKIIIFTPSIMSTGCESEYLFSSIGSWELLSPLLNNHHSW